jgi:hypothetical protein
MDATTTAMKDSGTTAPKDAGAVVDARAKRDAGTPVDATSSQPEAAAPGDDAGNDANATD